MAAGYRSDTAVPVFYGFKLICGVLLFFVMVFCRVSGATTWFEVRNRKFTNLGLLADHLLTLSDTWEYSIPARG